jgi:hypothetical protein
MPAHEGLQRSSPRSVEGERGGGGAGFDAELVQEFKPTTAAAESASLAVSVPQDPSSPHNVSLTGTGS